MTDISNETIEEIRKVTKGVGYIDPQLAVGYVHTLLTKVDELEGLLQSKKLAQKEAPKNGAN